MSRHDEPAEGEQTVPRHADRRPPQPVGDDGESTAFISRHPGGAGPNAPGGWPVPPPPVAPPSPPVPPAATGWYGAGPVPPPAAHWGNPQIPPGGPPPWYPPPMPSASAAGPVRRRTHLRWWIVGAAAAIAAVLVTAVVVTRNGDGSNSAATHASSSSRPTAAATAPRLPAPPSPSKPPQPPAAPVDVAALPGLLSSPEEIGQLVDNATMEPSAVEKAPASGLSVTPAHCAGAVAPVTEATYSGSGYSGLAGQALNATPTPTARVIQGVVSFADADFAKFFYDTQLTLWRGCQDTDVTVAYSGGDKTDHVHIADVAESAGMASVLIVPSAATTNRQCQRALTVRNNVVVDVRVCSPDLHDAGMTLARNIAQRIPG